jgi:multiple antibiotic resistance protein
MMAHRPGNDKPCRAQCQNGSFPQAPKTRPMDFKPLVTLLAIVNPLAIVPFFIHYTLGFSAAQRQRTIWIAAFSAFVVIAISALMGLHILAFFGISLAMLNAQPAEAKANEEELHAASARASIAVVPLTIPLLTGPATMSTVVILATGHAGGLRRGHRPGHRAVLFTGRAHCPRLG